MVERLVYMDRHEFRFEGSSVESRRKTVIVQVVVAAVEGLLMVSLCHLGYQALVGVVEGSMHHTGKSFENGEAIGRPCLM